MVHKSNNRNIKTSPNIAIKVAPATAYNNNNQCQLLLLPRRGQRSSSSFSASIFGSVALSSHRIREDSDLLTFTCISLLHVLIDPSSVVDGSASYYMYHWYPFPSLRDNNESSPTDVSRLPDQIRAPLSPPSDHMQPHHQRYNNKKKRRIPGLQAWKRRLNTKEDSHSLHKISNPAFVLSSTAILGGMMFGSDGF